MKQITSPDVRLWTLEFKNLSEKVILHISLNSVYTSQKKGHKSVITSECSDDKIVSRGRLIAVQMLS